MIEICKVCRRKLSGSSLELLGFNRSDSRPEVAFTICDYCISKEVMGLFEREAIRMHPGSYLSAGGGG